MTETGGQATDWTMALSDDQAADFLRRLATDDDFRRRLEQSPAQAFAESGIPAPPDALAGEVRVPPKEDLQAAFSGLFPDWRRPSLFTRIVHALGGKPKPAPPQYGLWCKCWALAFLAGSRVQKPEQ